jgi:arabinofuranosyltransferase
MRRPPSLLDPRATALKIVLLAAACFYGVFILRSSFRIAGQTYFTLIDDAMVSMRYAHHVAQGYGLVWNIGEKPIEGFTNPGWMLFMAGLHLVQIPAAQISAVVMVAAAVILLLNVYLVYKICEALRPEARYGPLIAGGITAFYFPLVFWSLRGMEVGVLACLASAGVLAALRLERTAWRPVVLLSVILIAAIVVRLDAVLQAIIIALYVLSTRKVSLRRSALPIMVIVLTAVGILFLQKGYFGDFLPNTYYQKVVGASLADRVKNGLLAFNDYATRDTLMLVLFSAAGLLLYKDMRRREFAMLGLLFLVQCAYSISVGGDYAEPEVNAANRFITQGMPALIILFGITLDHMISDIRSAHPASDEARPSLQAAISMGAAVAALLVISGQPWVNWGIDNAPLLKADVRRVKIGLAIAQYTSPEATIAVHAAGQIPYYSDRRTIDLLGLNDPVVAKGPVTGPFYPGHDKWNYDYSILQLKPDLIADNWIKLGDFMKGVDQYQQLDNGMYVRKDSTLVQVQGLSSISQ